MTQYFGQYIKIKLQVDANHACCIQNQTPCPGPGPTHGELKIKKLHTRSHAQIKSTPLNTEIRAIAF